MAWMRFQVTYCKEYPSYCTKANFISKWMNRMKRPFVLYAMMTAVLLVGVLIYKIGQLLFAVTGWALFKMVCDVFAAVAFIAGFSIPLICAFVEATNLLGKIAISEGYDPKVKKWGCKCGTVRPVNQTYCPCCKDWRCKCGITRPQSKEYCYFCKATRNDQSKVKVEPKVEVEDSWTCKCGITRPRSKERCPYCEMTSRTVKFDADGK